MTRKHLVAMAIVATLPAISHAADITLTFEGATSFAAVADFYNGGTDSAGIAGSNVGVAFTGAALALQNDALGNYFSNAPTPGTVLFAPDSAAVMNVASGFIGGLQFYYASATSALDLVNIYSGPNGTGALLASASVFGNAAIGCTDTPFCRFDLTSVRFAGVAQSAVFGSNAGAIAYDNITFTAAPVPEPSTYALMLAGIAAVGFMAKRRRG